MPPVLVASEEGGAPAVAWDDVFFHRTDDLTPPNMPFATIVTKDYPSFDEQSNLDRNGAFRLDLPIRFRRRHVALAGCRRNGAPLGRATARAGVEQVDIRSGLGIRLVRLVTPFICGTCGVQYDEADSPPERCVICGDAR